MSKTGTLTPGQTLGRYEIAAFLAAGGMGEVYKAFDARLNRVVAIKVSPARAQAEGRAVDARPNRHTRWHRGFQQHRHPRSSGVHASCDRKGLARGGTLAGAGADDEPSTHSLRLGPNVPPQTRLAGRERLNACHESDRTGAPATTCGAGRSGRTISVSRNPIARSPASTCNGVS